jgi:hypothetical protein
VETAPEEGVVVERVVPTALAVTVSTTTTTAHTNAIVLLLHLREPLERRIGSRGFSILYFLCIISFLLFF